MKKKAPHTQVGIRLKSRFTSRNCPHEKKNARITTNYKKKATTIPWRFETVIDLQQLGLYVTSVLNNVPKPQVIPQVRCSINFN